MDLTYWIMIFGWVFVLIWIPAIIYSNKNTHPKALFILFFAEMWERFSYYGMRALLTLYMVQVLFAELSQSAADTKALGIYGSYTAMVYLFPVIGGIVADKIYGFRKAIILGGVLMIFGHFSLALEGMFFEGNMMLFFLSLALIIVGNGLFKPNVSSFLGKFYTANDPRKDGGFTIFYMGVNIGAFLSILTCGYVGQTISWHYGFGLAGIGMFLGLLVFVMFGQNAFGNKGILPSTISNADDEEEGSESETSTTPTTLPQKIKTQQLLTTIATIAVVPVCAFMLGYSEAMTYILIFLSIGILGVLVAQSFAMESKVAGQRLLVVVVLFVFHAMFWALFEQAGGSITLFTERNVDRVVFGSEIPASIFQFFNSLFIILLAPVFSWMWGKMSKKGAEPSTPMKFVLGLSQLALGFAVLVLGAKFFADDGLMPVLFLVIMYFFHTTGELSISPVGLSMITKLSPAKAVGFVMGAWFLSMALANKMAGLIGELTASDDSDRKLSVMESLGVYTDTYLIWGVFVVAASAILLVLLVPQLKKWMHGIH